MDTGELKTRIMMLEKVIVILSVICTDLLLLLVGRSESVFWALVAFSVLGVFLGFVVIDPEGLQMLMYETSEERDQRKKYEREQALAKVPAKQ